MARSFARFRECGNGRRECQVLWTSSWHSPDEIRDVVHPEHHAHGGGFTLDSHWLHNFWLKQAETNSGIRVQVHTHPRRAFHSRTDDRFPIIHTPGFLSLVIPNFGLGEPSFEGAYLTEIQPNGTWKEVPIASRLTVI